MFHVKLFPNRTSDIHRTQSFLKLSLPVSEVTRSSLHLPTLGPVLRGISKNLYKGTGMGLLQGFPIQSYSKEQQIIIFLVLNPWIGDQYLSQGIDYNLIYIKIRLFFIL